MARIDANSPAGERSALLSPADAAPAYMSDSVVYDMERSAHHRTVFYGPGTHYATTMSSGDEAEDEPEAEASDEDEDDDEHLGLVPAGFRTAGASTSTVPRVTWRGKFKKSGSSPPAAKSTASRFTRRSRMRSIKKRLKGPPTQQKPLRVSAYCTSDQLQLFKLLKWLDRVETGQLPGGELHPDGWKHKMYMGAIHSTCSPPEFGDEDSPPDAYRQKDAFYFATGCAVFWGLTRIEEQAHLRALTAFSVGPVKQIEVEDMDFTYGDTSRIVNDEITLSSNRAAEKLAIAFAMAQSAKLDVFEERVEETIQETKHVPQSLATTGAIRYSLSDISKLIGQLFIVRSDVNLNSDMLDEPDFFWEDDEFQPLYKKTMRYLDVDKRVEVLNTRLDILRELLDVLSQQLVHHHGTKLELIVIWLIVAEVLISVVWNMLIKDILGFFPRSDTE